MNRKTAVPSLLSIAAAGMIAVFTVLLYQANTVDNVWLDNVVSDLREMKQLDAMINRDVLKARYRLYHDYDPLVAAAQRTEVLLRALRNGDDGIYQIGDASIDYAFESYVALQNQRRKILERFKSKNAILKNSLNYFASAGAEMKYRLQVAGVAPAFSAALDQLAQDTLFYVLSGNTALKPGIEALVQRLNHMLPAQPGSVTDSVRLLFKHNLIILSYRDAVDGLIAAILDQPTGVRNDDLHKAFSSNIERRQRRAAAYQIALYLCSVGLVLYIFYVLLRLRGALADRDRGNAELTRLNLSLADEIRERREIERALREAKDEAEAASRTKSEFLANMSHELRTPLNAIIGFSSILAHQSLGRIGNERYVEYAVDINNSGAHLLDLINDILDLSKIEAGKMELNEGPVDFARVVGQCISLVAARAKDRAITVERRVVDGLPKFLGDERKIKQILINLLSNAVKFSHEGGTVRVSVDRSTAHGIDLSVRDEGIGMSAEDIETAVSLFGQVDGALSRRFEGTGLGLPLTSALAALHGGELLIDSVPGRGTTVTVRLPPDRIMAAETAAGRGAAA